MTKLPRLINHPLTHCFVLNFRVATLGICPVGHLNPQFKRRDFLLPAHVPLFQSHDACLGLRLHRLQADRLSTHQSGVRWLDALIKLRPDVQHGFIKRLAKIGIGKSAFITCQDSSYNLCVCWVTEQKSFAYTANEKGSLGSLGGFSLHPKH